MRNQQHDRATHAWRKANSLVYRRRLGPRQIRLLRLLPSKDREAPVEIDLIITDLDKNNGFKAISYTWGKEALSQCIWVNSKPFWVRPNLWKLLLDLRYEVDSRTVWIDAIAINQMSIDERNAQVRLMWEIYSKAIGVIIWLNNEISSPVQPPESTTEDEPAPLKRRSSAEGAAFLSALSKHGGHAPSTSYNDVQSVKWLLGHSYFGRQWVVPECALAKDVTVFCGGQLFPLSTLTELFVANPSLDSELKNLIREAQGCLAYKFCALNRDLNNDASQVRLRDILEAFRHNECSEPKDKIYALLSLCPAARTHITVDYRSYTETVLIETLEYISAHESLRETESMAFGQMLLEILSLRACIYPLRAAPGTLSPKIDCETRQFFQTQLVHVATVTKPPLTLYQHARSLQSTMTGSLVRTFTPLCLKDTTNGMNRANPSQMYLEPGAPHKFVEDVSPQDLHPFTWVPRCQKASTGSDQLCFGLATTDIMPGHLICVFHGSETALVIEKSRQQYAVTGRAIVRVAEQDEDNTHDNSGDWSHQCAAACEAATKGPKLIIASRGASTMSLLQLGVPVEGSRLRRAG